MHNPTKSPVKFDNLEQRVLAAKNDSVEMNKLIEEYIPFIRKTAIRVIPPGTYDSFSSTAMSAFAEAVQKFRDNKGKFLGFAALVITNRVKDQIRKEYKPKEIPSEDIEVEATFEERTDRKMEVDMFRDELSDFGIILDDLLKESPKHKGSRNKANLAAETLSGNEVLFKSLKDSGKVPVKRLSELSGITVKLIEQKRKYIIAGALLRQNKYSYLREFIR
jgi:RNA polymerase sigma factor